MISSSSSRYYLGVDLGGTKLEAVLLELPADTPLSDSRIQPMEQVRARIRVPTQAHLGYAHVRARLLETLLAMLDRVPEAARARARIGIGLPGHISRQTGVVKNANSTCLNGEDLWGDVRRALRRPVGFDNDANCLTLAEATWGAARGEAVVFGVILGTGVGGGMAHEGRIWPGLQGIAGEWGHNVLEPGGRPCYCGRRGCVETYLSGPGLELTILEKTGLRLSAQQLNALLSEAAGLEPGLDEALEGYLEQFARALAVVINVLDPAVVVIGGGLSRLEPLYARGRELLANRIFNEELLTPIRPALLGDAAGVYGAALIGQC